MKVMFLEAAYESEVNLCQEALDYFKRKKYKTVGLYASVQFVNCLERVKQQLQQCKIKVITSKPDRAHVNGQLLGCDVFENSLNLNQEVDCYLYVGDGNFHPLALVYAQKNKKVVKEVISNDPITKVMSVFGLSEINNILRRYQGAMAKFLNSKNIGVIISLKPGQEHFQLAWKLKKIYPEKKFYYFIDHTVSFDQLENFSFIDVWVNTACPRIALDEQGMFLKSVVNINDVLN